MFSENYINAYTKGKAIIYVEDQNDISFWKSFFDNFSLGYKVFQISKAPGALANGKKELIKIIPNLHSRLYIAIDSDFDFICKNRNPLIHENIINNSYVLHTYLYNKESHEYSLSHINKCIEKIFYTLDIESNFHTFIESYSKLCFILLSYITFFLEKKIPFKISEFKKFLTFKSNDFFYISDTFVNLANNKILELNSYIKEKFNEIETSNEFINHIKYLNNIGIDLNNSYQYINGHLLERTILKFLKEYKSFVKSKEIQEANISYPEGKPRSQEIDKINNFFEEKCSILTLINSQGINWDCTTIQKILFDVSQLIKNH